MEPEVQNPTVLEKKPEGAPRNHMRIIAGVVVLLVVLFAGVTAAAIRYYPPATATWSALTLPGELRNTLFIKRASDANIYTVTAHGYVSNSAQQGKYVVYAAPKNDALFVMVDPATQVYRIELDSKVLLTSKEPIATAALSPNKKGVVYAKQKEGKVGSRDASDWEVVLFFTATGKSAVVSPGFAPFFIDDSRIARFTNAGIYSIDITTATQTELLKQEFKQVLPSFSQSPDHTLIAWSDPIAKATLVYRVDSTLTRVMSFDGFVPLFALSDSALYRLQLTTKGTNIYKYTLDSADSASMIHTVPASLQVSALSL